MKRFSEQLYKQAETVRLSASEKRDLRERVQSYMEYHPLPVRVNGQTKRGEGEVATVQLIRIGVWRSFAWSGIVLSGLLLALTLVAERSVPGDALYAIKVSLTEELRSTLARTPYEKVVWETERLNRRIAEARLLASEGKLTEEAEAEVAEAVRGHSETARREIEILRQTDKDEAALAALQFTTVVEVQATALKHVSESEASSSTPSLIENALSVSREISAVADEATELPAYNRLIARVELETTRARELLATIEKAATPAEQVDIKRRLDDIDRAIIAGMGKVEADELAARSELVSVLQRTQRLIVFMTNIDVRQSITVEEIVPVSLTVEERNQVVVDNAKEVTRLVSVTEATIASTTDAALVEKLLPAIEEGRVAASTTLSAIPYTEADLPAVEQRMVEALALLTDVATALGLSPQAKSDSLSDVAIEPTPLTDELSVPTEEMSTTSIPLTEVSATTTGTSTEVIVEESVVDDSTVDSE